MRALYACFAYGKVVEMCHFSAAAFQGPFCSFWLLRSRCGSSSFLIPGWQLWDVLLNSELQWGLRVGSPLVGPWWLPGCLFWGPYSLCLGSVTELC